MSAPETGLDASPGDAPPAPDALPLPCRIPEMLASIRDCVPDALVDPAAWQRLGAIEDPLPPLGREAALECRLEPGSGAVDFELCLRGPGRPRLADFLSGGVAEAGLPTGWRRPVALLRAWCDPTSRLHDGVRAVWLEFDVPADGAPPTPFGVVTLDAESFYATGVADRRAIDSTLRTALDLLAGRLDAATGEAVSRVLADLPATAQVLHAAVRPTDRGDVARLVVAMPWRQAADALARLGWPGRPAALHEDLEALCPETQVHSFNLDIGAAPGPRVGVEFHHPTSPRADRRWRHLLDVLVDRGACCPQKRAALEQWGEPESSVRAGEIRRQRELLVKVVLDPGAPMRAKAYLPFSTALVLG